MDTNISRLKPGVSLVILRLNPSLSWHPELKKRVILPKVSGQVLYSYMSMSMKRIAEVILSRITRAMTYCLQRTP